jgi:hydrogenase nickel incorporation protein HypA/HybF
MGLAGRTGHNADVHEMGVTEQIVAVACAAARQEGEETRVSRIVVEIGALSAVLPEAVASCFETCAQGTPAEGADLEVVEVAGEGRCRSCGGRVLLSQPFASCACGGEDVELVSGDQLKIIALEVVMRA